MENNRKRDNKSNLKEFNFQWFIVNLLIHWKWFALSIILFLSGAYIKQRYVVPTYNVGATIILKDVRRGGMNNSERSVFEGMGIVDANSNIENEADIIRSRNLLERVITRERLFIRYSVQGRFRNTDLYDSGNTNFYSALPVKVFVDSTIIAAIAKRPVSLVISLTENSMIRVDGNCGFETFSKEYSSLPGVLKTPIGEFLLIANERVSLRKEYPLHVDLLPPLQVAMRYRGSMNVGLGKNTTIVNLSVTETQFRRGEDFLLALIDLYNEDTMEDKNKATQNAANFISARLVSLREELNNAEAIIQDYRQDIHSANLQTETSLDIQGERSYENSLITFATQQELINYLTEAIDKDVHNNREFLPTFHDNLLNASIIKGVEDYNRIIAEKHRLFAYTNENLPMIGRMDDRINRTREELRANIKTFQQSMDVQKQQYENRFGDYNANVGDVPRREREMTDLSRQQSIKSGLFMELSRRLDEIQLTLAVTYPTAKILENPLSNPVIPRKMPLYMMCLVIGIIFPYVVIGIREVLNYKLTHEEEIRRFSDVSVAVSLPLIKTKKPLVVTPIATTAIVERFRLLRTNMQFILNSPEKKTILVTSTISGEGKTFVSINLAMTFSLKYKTILVGLDIRRPKISSYLNLPKQIGLISYLTGEETKLDNLIYKNINDSNLDVLISGIVPPNPNELLMDKTLDNLFVALRERYDYIIVDSSPVGSVSDSFLLNRITDASLFVIRKDHSPKSAISLLNNINDEKRLNNVSIVLNAFSEKSLGRYGYGYGSYGSYGYGGYGYGGGYGGYGYGYGYGYETKN
jgi:capsular exopolysaccharide synthesis family protein